MKFLSRLLILMAAMALSACGGAARFGDDNTVNLNGANAGVDDPTSPAYFEQAVGDRVLFEVDQHTLTTQARQVLDGQADWLLRNADYDAVIEGHADEQGTREYNLALGARRANSVLEYLLSRGVPAERLDVVSYGKERPIEICSAESCYAKNRRAVTVITAGVTG
ncbi:peptidoglycan-associated lipoprotein Pal [Roseovarius sp. TE539]|uniref:peptidoglycan-associated lipoprotein Pal n=1 Tax=Roseovarius sp. TE539 TaxID=2249812 RepID=UPI0015EE7CCE|nr:peptidoglycan-associated lipoprotein Pal [Roseovarius sp. TE539]